MYKHIMHVIANSKMFRENIINSLSKLFVASSIATTLENGIYDYSVKKADSNGVIKEWSNCYFTEIYLNRLKTVRYNLQLSDNINKLNNNIIMPYDFANMSHQEMCPDKWKTLLENKRIRDQNKYETNLEASTDDFKCWKCKSKKCTYYQLQTRSSDEPMTTFVTCLDCGNRWKC